MQRWRVRNGGYVIRTAKGDFSSGQTFMATADEVKPHMWALEPVPLTDPVEEKEPVTLTQRLARPEPVHAAVPEAPADRAVHTPQPKRRPRRGGTQ